MARANLKHFLEDSELLVRRGRRNADRQREAVSALECADHDAAIAKRLLVLFEKANEIHVADRDRLIEDLREVAQHPDSKPA
jgi:hypothetical protein